MIRRGWRMASTRSMGKKSSSSRTRGWACGPAATAFRIEDSMTTQTQELGKFSLGVGDRFAHQAKAQLQACMLAAQAGVEVIPVWNKSNREHNIIGSEPASTRAAADAAVQAMGWKKPYFCDADHINLTTVDRFLGSCDFYTIDVADAIGKSASPDA